MSARSNVEQLAEQIGVTINGPAATDLQIHDESVYRTLLSGNNVAIGEAFMDKRWDVADLAGLYTKILQANITEQIGFFTNPSIVLRAALLNLQSRARSFEVGQEHYDIGNDLYEVMLDERMVYTCAIWDGVDTLDAAQEQKLEAICQQLDLKPGQRVLDIGCGWGSFMKYAAQKYGVSCVGLTVSKEQTTWGRNSCAGLPIEFVITDYRDYVDSDGFDHVVSVEMIEAVGAKNFKTFYTKIHELLHPGGRFVLQTIGSNDKHPAAEPWMDKYIFPNGVLPSLYQLEEASRGRFIMEHLRNIGPDYDRTLIEWWRRFDTAYPELSAENPKYDQRFYRMWKYYLQGCAGMFRTREGQDWIITYLKI